jgi:hypothetical protein
MEEKVRLFEAFQGVSFLVVKALPSLLPFYPRRPGNADVRFTLGCCGFPFYDSPQLGFRLFWALVTAGAVPVLRQFLSVRRLKLHE